MDLAHNSRLIILRGIRESVGETASVGSREDPLKQFNAARRPSSCGCLRRMLFFTIALVAVQALDLAPFNEAEPGERLAWIRYSPHCGLELLKDLAGHLARAREVVRRQ